MGQVAATPEDANSRLFEACDELNRAINDKLSEIESRDGKRQDRVDWCERLKLVSENPNEPELTQAYASLSLFVADLRGWVKESRLYIALHRVYESYNDLKAAQLPPNSNA